MKKREKKIRLAIVGCGGIAWGCHVPYYKRDARVEVVAVCDIVKGKAEAMRKERFPKAAVYADYREVMARKDVDAVDICTPNDLHSEIAVAALKAGKHVMCEKPDAVSPEKAEAMKAASEKSKKLLMVMRNNRFAGASQFARKYIEAGRMGEIYAGRCGWQRRRGIPGKGGWFTTKAKSGGGPLIDLGVHMIDLAVWLMGSPRPVAVSGNTFCKFANDDGASDSEHAKFGEVKADGIFDVEDLAMGLIRFDNGAVLQIEFSWASNIKAETRFVELRGTKAGMNWKDGNVEFYSEENGVLTDVAPAGVMPDHGHDGNLKNFVDVLCGVAEPSYTPRQGVDMIKILAALYASAKSGREVVIG
ncbi:MAG: Gfo/Idh/MocA family oxidoreductase [Kiritimatiellaeota bacterium]|nr:Gfo/Idh/MocA family oxidoreductase [Kiritimatiellota bacterium]